MFVKSKLKKLENFTYCFITEDLTPLRVKLLHYVKNECDDKFVLVHTMNGKITCKKAAKSEGQIIWRGDKDEGIGGWITFTSPEDLVKFDVEVHFNKFNYLPLMFNDDVNINNSDVNASVSSCSSSGND